MDIIRIYKIVVVAVLLGTTSVSSAVEDTWTRKAKMPTARYGLSTSVVDGKIYAIGGGQAMYGAYLSTVEEYDPVTDTWTRRANMPTARYGHAASVVDGKIYVIGGEPTEQASLATVEEYDPATDTWTKKTDMPTKRSFLCACAVDGKIYVFGGITAGVPGAVLNPPAMDVYDPAKDSWTTKADILTPRVMGSACVLGKRIYFMGGVKGNVHNPALATMEEYNPATDTWTRKVDMPTPRDFPSASAVGGRIYVIGGGIIGSTFSVLEEYDPVTDAWTRKTDMSTRRWMHASSAVNGKIYAIGGTRIWHPWSGISRVEEYDTGFIFTPQPQPDFNGDGLVDIKDLLKLIESWGRDDPMVDIAPPFGDGIVDALDLELVMNYWGQPVDDPTLIAHWALDETEGTIAWDSAGTNDAVTFGDPLWLPTGGIVDGAIQLDGIDDYIITSPVLNPADGPFSVLAWIKGGAPWQTVISEPGSANWLSADLSNGSLITELKASGRSGAPLLSQTVITDGNWHRIGFVWDGLNRTLYVDGVVAVEDTQDSLHGLNSGLYIGTGKAMESGTFFSGLIDDVRIYDRAVTP
ncbi:MAG: Kelch repeat-containing protein [Planctomycetota bacterium]